MKHASLTAAPPELPAAPTCAGTVFLPKPTEHDSSAARSASLAKRADGAIFSVDSVLESPIITYAPQDDRLHTRAGRILGYVRVSSQKQDEPGASPAMQKEVIEANFARSNARELRLFFEVESGTKKGEIRRVEVAKLLREVRAGDTVVVTDLDHFTRNLLFAVEKVREVVERGARFVSEREGEFDNTPDGEFQLTLYAAIAQREHARILQRTSGNRKRLRSFGKWVEGRPPLGYKLAPKAKNGEKPRILVIDPETAPAVLAVFQLSAQGKNIDQITAYMRAHFGFVPIKWNRSTVLRTLRSPVYTGRVALTPYRPSHHDRVEPFPAEWVESHEPIVDDELFARVQHGLTLRRRSDARAYTPGKTKDWLLRALARCGLCGSVIGCAPTHKSSRHAVNGYYICRHRTHPGDLPRCNGAPYLRQDDTDRLVRAALRARLRELPGLLARTGKAKAPVPTFERELQDTKEARERVLSLVADPKVKVPLGDVADRLRELNEKIASLTEAARQHKRESAEDSPEARERVVACLAAMEERWDTLDTSELRVLIALLAVKVAITVKGTLDFQWRELSSLGAAMGEARGALAARLTPPALPAPLASADSA